MSKFVKVVYPFDHGAQRFGLNQVVEVADWHAYQLVRDGLVSDDPQIVSYGISASGFITAVYEKKPVYPSAELPKVK